MSIEEVKSNLCYWNLLNPNTTASQDEIDEQLEWISSEKQQCHCDNCFHGRSELAEYILTLINN